MGGEAEAVERLAQEVQADNLTAKAHLTKAVPKIQDQVTARDRNLVNHLHRHPVVESIKRWQTQ